MALTYSTWVQINSNTDNCLLALSLSSHVILDFVVFLASYARLWKCCANEIRKKYFLLNRVRTRVRCCWGYCHPPTRTDTTSISNLCKLCTRAGLIRIKSALFHMSHQSVPAPFSSTDVFNMIGSAPTYAHPRHSTDSRIFQWNKWLKKKSPFQSSLVSLSCVWWDGLVYK